MEFIFTTTLYLISVGIFFSIGFLINKKFNFSEKLRNTDLLFIGYSVFIILSFHLYFILNISTKYLIIIFPIIILIFSIVNLNFFRKNKMIIIKNLILFISFFLIFYIPSIFYGEQFFIFRGNYWDHFNYLSSSMLFNKYNFNDLKSLEIITNYKNFQNISSIIIYRPFVNFFQSLYLNFKFLDIFFIAHSFKIFLTFLNFLALKSFLDIFKNLKFYEKNLISFIFSISFFSLYVFEIDALAHLASISIFLMSIKYLHLIFDKNKKKTFHDAILLSIFSSSLFIIYPEIFCVYLIIVTIYLSTKLLFYKKKINFKIILSSILFFFIFTISSFEVNYKFLILQLNHAINSHTDWWGYFGGFIFGKKSLILDPNYVEAIKNNILNKNVINLANQFYSDHINNGYNYFLLNLIPSIFGLYYLTLDNTIIGFKNIFIIFSLGLNFYILLILKLNIQHIFKKKLIFIQLNLIIFMFITLYLLINQNFWIIIKLYSYFLVFIYLLVCIDFKKESINYLMLILVCIFPIYKFTSFNYGIGKHDSFPSIIDKKYKQNINWNLDRNKLSNCDILYSNEQDYFVNRYIEIKTIYNGKSFQNNVYKKNIKKACNVSIIKKNFIVRSVE
tara:strand:- start:4693 stop:6543 length:1851 start_codon:yes stop_codon:yes gene_type:complete